MYKFGDQVQRLSQLLFEEAVQLNLDDDEDVLVSRKNECCKLSRGKAC